MGDFIPTTGAFVAKFPRDDSAEYDEFLGLIRLGITFQKQHRGRRPGFFQLFIRSTVASMKKPQTFANLLDELELDIARRNARGESIGTISKVNRVWQTVTYFDPGEGEIEITFKTLKNNLTKAKKSES